MSDDEVGRPRFVVRFSSEYNTSLYLFCSVFAGQNDGAPSMSAQASKLREEDAQCSRPASREARTLVATRVLEMVRAAGGSELAPSCSLHPRRDRLAAHEAAKRRLNMQHWKCSLCGKAFGTERHLDLHLHRKHADAVTSEATACLGDYCDVLRCPSWVARIRAPAGSEPASMLEEGERPHSCSDTHLARRRDQCRALMHACAFGPVFAELDAE